MGQIQVSRRGFLQEATATAVAVAEASKEKAVEQRATKPAAIASPNGLKAMKKTMELLRQGADPLDAAIEGVALVESDPNDMTVGYGGIPNELGVVELDAAVMHGPTHRAGSVASLRGIKTPSRVAKLVMEYTDHELLVGEGALQFALSFGFKQEDLLTDRSRKVWLRWRANRSDKDDWLPLDDSDDDPVVRRFLKSREYGTIHCSVLDSKGDLASVTSTSGLFFKIPGRVGDSPIIGAGLYVDNDVGACGSTGRGEANLLNCSCFLVVENMRHGMTPREACFATLKRVINKTEPRLLKSPGRPKFDLKLYAINKEGEYAGVSIWSGGKFCICDSRGCRLEPCAYLLKHAEH